MNHAAITRAMHTRGIFVAAVIITATATALSYLTDGGDNVLPTRGFVAGWGAGLPLTAQANLIITAACNAVIVGAIYYINKVYNLLRSLTYLHCTMLLILSMATPTILTHIGPGPLLASGVLWCLSLMYINYGEPRCDTRKVLLVFCLLSGCSSFCYAFALFIPVFILACFQLRFFSLRCAFAILMGIATPWILLFGFGIVHPGELQLPVDSFGMPSLHSMPSALLDGTVILTASLTIGALLQNAIKMITYNAQSRAMLSVVTTVTIITVTFAIIDISNIYSYLTLLDCCAAFQLAHLFLAIHNFSKSYIGVIIIMLTYILIYTWVMIASISW